MIVNVIGFGPINFPESMTEEEVKQVLKQFEKKPDERFNQTLETIEKLLKNQKQQVVEVPKIVEIEKEKIIQKPEIVEVEKQVIVEKMNSPSSWKFTIYRDDDEISEIVAEPYGE